MKNLLTLFEILIRVDAFLILRLQRNKPAGEKIKRFDGDMTELAFMQLDEELSSLESWCGCPHVGSNSDEPVTELNSLN